MRVKTSQTAAKRIHLRKGGKLVRDNAGTSHLFSHKSDRPTQPAGVAASDRKKMLKLIAKA